MPAKTPLDRPPLPAVTEALAWPHRLVVVFGPGDLAFARALAEGLSDARVLRVELRHAEGFDLHGDDAAHAHPDTVLDALRALRDRASDASVTVGVGPVFAVATRPDHLVWITGGETALALPGHLRSVARAAHLALEEPRLATARALAERLSDHGQ